ncbi:MAG: hypothetical protein ACE5JR_10780 [Gemmatimonadota bacterium]
MQEDSIVVIERGTPAVNGWDVAELPFRLVTLPILIIGNGSKLAFGGKGYLIPNVTHLFGQIQARGVHPLIHRQGASSSIGGGLLLGVPPTREGPWAHVLGGATIKEYWLLGARLGYGSEYPEPRPRLGIRRGGPFTVQGYGFRAHRAQDKFYGPGRDSRNENRSDYDRDQYEAGAVVILRPLPNSELRFFARWTQDDIGAGDADDLPDVDSTFAASEIPGFGERWRYVSFGTTVGWRVGRLHTMQRHDRWLEASYTWNDSRSDGAADYGRLELSAGIELPFDRKRESLAFALRYVALRPSGEGAIPFYRLASLGGSHSLASYHTYRFADQESILGQAEYRYRVWSEVRDEFWLDGILFLYEGMVAESLSDEFRFERLKESYGFGLAFITPESEVARITFNWGDDGFLGRFSFLFGL